MVSNPFRKLYIVAVSDRADAALLQRLLPMVSAEKAAQVLQYRNPADKKISLLAQAAAKKILANMHGIPLRDIPLTADALGKPCVADRPDIHFNISHTRGWIAIACSDRPVGVDIERMRTNGSAIADRFFTAEEAAWIRRESTPDAFLKIWTQKEAFAKCSGVGLRRPLREFCVLDSTLQDKFITLRYADTVISFYDGASDKNLPLTVWTEDEAASFFR